MIKADWRNGRVRVSLAAILATVAVPVGAAQPSPADPRISSSMSLYCDGTGSGFLYRGSMLPATTSFPFWVAAWVKLGPRRNFGGTYNIFSSERTANPGANGVGNLLDVGNQVPRALSANQTTLAQAKGREAVLTAPYWDHLMAEFRSSSDRRIYINGALSMSNVTGIAAQDYSTNAQTRIGQRAAAGTSQPFYGSIADVVVGTGILSDADRGRLAALGCDYATLPGVAHWYPLNGSGADSVGSAPMSVSGSVVWTNDAPRAVASPTRADYIRQVFSQTNLPATMPVVSVGVSPLSTNSGNLRNVEYLDIAFTNACGRWNTRLFHFIPTARRQGHVVFYNSGHTTLSGLDEAGGTMTINALVDNGYAVVLSILPGFYAGDPWYGGADHDRAWSLWTPAANPLAFFFQPIVAGMNYAAALYPRRSVAGLSGGGWMAPRVAALDARFNWAVVPIRGTLADRRMIGSFDFEQCPAPNGWRIEELYRLAADGRRLWFVVHPYDDCCFGIAPPASGSTGYPSGAYLDANDYDATFLDPIRLAVPTDLRFIEDQGPVPHAVTSWTLNNVILPAITNALPFGEPWPLWVSNAGVANVTAHSADLVGHLESTGAAPVSVSVFWGRTDGGQARAAWARTNDLGRHGVGLITNRVTGLDAGVTYYYRFCATNADGEAWADPPGVFTTVTDFSAYERRMKITFTGYTRAETLSNFPVLVLFSPAAIPQFRYGDFRSPRGYDLRFADAGVTTELNYEIEAWDTNAISCVWVQVPRLEGANTSIWACWGNEGAAAAPALCCLNGATWDSGFRGVWHLASSSSDSTANSMHGADTAIGYGTSHGKIGPGGVTTAKPSGIAIPSSTLGAIGTGNFSAEMWIKPNPPSAGSYPLMFGSFGRNDPYIGPTIFYDPLNQTGLGFGDATIFRVSKNNHYGVTNPPASSMYGSWQHIVFTRQSGTNRVYYNGTQKLQFYDNISIPAADYAYLLSRSDYSPQSFNAAANGDEFRVSNVARSSNWIWATYMNQTSNSVFASCGEVIPVACRTVVSIR